MNSRTRHAALAAVLAALLTTLAACGTDRDPATLFAPEAVGVLVVDAVLIVDQPLPSLRLTRTQPPDTPYSLEDAGVAGATVTVTVGGEVRDYEPDGSSRGLYRPVLGPTELIVPIVLPLTRYDLAVTTSAGEVLSATTTTPDHFTVDRWVLIAGDGVTEVRDLQTFADVGDGVYTHPDNQLTYAEGLLDGYYGATDAATFGAAGFQVALFSLDEDAGLVIDPPFLDEEDLADLPREGASPALNGEDGYVRLPWFGIYYDGRHLYKAFAVDRNWFDLVRTIPQGGGSFGFGGNIGDGVDPPLFRVNGGIGLFGSAAVDSLGFFIRPLE